jgi:hypothetical protein
VIELIVFFLPMFIIWIARKKIHAKKGDSTETMNIRPEELMAELDIKKSKYYEVLKELNIKADKDSNQKSYLTNEKADRIRAYLLNDIRAAENEDSNNNSIVIVNDSNEIVSNNNKTEDDIYIKPEEVTAQFDFNQLLRKASEVKTRRLATPDLIVQELANRMNEDDLPEDLKEKLSVVREAVNPKFTPADIAENLLSRYRSLRES